MKITKQTYLAVVAMLVSSMLVTLAIWNTTTDLIVSCIFGLGVLLISSALATMIDRNGKRISNSDERQSARSKHLEKEVSRVLFHAKESSRKSDDISRLLVRVNKLTERLANVESMAVQTSHSRSPNKEFVNEIQQLKSSLADFVASSKGNDTPRVSLPTVSGPSTTGTQGVLVPPKQAPSVSNESTEYSSRGPAPIAGKQKDAWVASRSGGPAFAEQAVEQPYRVDTLPFPDEIPVAMIADDFTYNSFSHEFNITRLKPKTWRSQFEENRPKLFICESAWQGGNPSEHPWQGKVYASIRWPKENRIELLEIIEYCRRHGIPTVFWNKEDPTHFSDRVNDFIRTAALFDYVFTTAEECVEDYKTYAAARHADVLPFAVQPRIFNPLGRRSDVNSVNFAGTWYSKYATRSSKAEKIMDMVVESGRELVIYDRMYQNPSPSYRFPERFRNQTRPAIPYEQTARAYRQAKFGITLNTVDDSRTMFARRIFELAASGAVVLSNEALGVRNFFGDSVIYADAQPEVYRNLDETGYRALQRDAMAIALNNTYEHRAMKILDTVGIKYQSRHANPAGLAVVASISEYEAAVVRARASSVLTGLIAVTAPECEDGLQFEAMRRRDENVVVLSNREMSNNEYRNRNFLSAPGVVTANANGEFLPDSELRWMISHSSYETGVIAKAADHTSSFRYGLVNSINDCYVPATSIKHAFNGQSPFEAYTV